MKTGSSRMQDVRELIPLLFMRKQKSQRQEKVFWLLVFLLFTVAQQLVNLTRFPFFITSIWSNSWRDHLWSKLS